MQYLYSTLATCSPLKGNWIDLHRKVSEWENSINYVRVQDRLSEAVTTVARSRSEPASVCERIPTVECKWKNCCRAEQNERRFFHDPGLPFRPVQGETQELVVVSGEFISVRFAWFVCCKSCYLCLQSVNNSCISFSFLLDCRQESAGYRRRCVYLYSLRRLPLYDG